MNKTIFFIPCDIYIRDFDSRLLIALSILKKNKNVKFIIGDQTQVNNYLVNNNNENCNEIYLEKGIDLKFSNWYLYLAKRGCKIYTLSEEGGIFEKNRELISFDIDIQNLSFIKKNFIWSNMIFDEIKNNKNFFLKYSEFLVTGNPRFDLCSKEFDSFYDSSLSKYKNKNCIVISSTFTQGNTNVPDEFSLIRFFSKKNFFKTEYSWDRKRKKYSNNMRMEFISLTKKIAINNPDLQIFFRPHPVESKLIYEKSFSKFKNILVNNSVAARDMIAISKTLIHHDCTTAIECYLNGKTPIAFLPFQDEELVQDIPIKLSYQLQKSEEVIKTLNNDFIDNINNNLLVNNYKYLLKNFEIKSYKRISRILNNEILNFSKSPKINFKNYYIKVIFFNLNALCIRIIRLFIENYSKYFLKKTISKQPKFMKDLTLSDFNKKIYSLSDIISLDNNFTTDILKKNLFIIESNK